MIIPSEHKEMTLLKTSYINKWSAVTWNDNQQDGILIASEEADSSRGSRPYVILIKRLLEDGWKPLSGLNLVGTFFRES